MPIRSIALVILLLSAACLASKCVTRKHSCEQVRHIAEENFPSDKVDLMVCIASLTGYCPTATNGRNIGMWSISDKWIGKPGCPTTAPEMANPEVAAKCASAILKTVGTSAWGDAALKCKEHSPKCLGRHHASTGAEVSVAETSGWGGPARKVDINIQKRSMAKRAGGNADTSAAVTTGKTSVTTGAATKAGSGYSSESSYYYYSSSTAPVYDGSSTTGGGSSTTGSWAYWGSTSTIGDSSTTSACWWCKK